MGAWIIFATSVEYGDERANSGDGGEADLVVDDQVDRAADPVAQMSDMFRLSATTPWPANAASPWMSTGSREGPGRVDLVLLGPDHAQDHRVDRLEVARVGGQLDRDVLAGLLLTYLPDRAEVVLHVARALDGVGVDVALELPEDLVVALADDVGQHVEPAAVGHAEHSAVEPVVGRRRQHRVEDAGSPTPRPRARSASGPTYFVPRNLSNASAAFSRSRMWRSSSAASCGRRPLRPWTGSSCFSSGSWMCMYSMPIRAAVRVAQDAEDVAERQRSTPARPPVRNSRSRSQIVSP